MAAVIGNREISLGVMGGTLITAACYSGGEVFGVTPYDKATTAYLKATYPLYWAQIRDYGFANPQLVPWINEDNDLIVSLVSVGKVRYVMGNNSGYFNTNIMPTDCSVEFDFRTWTFPKNSDCAVWLIAASSWSFDSYALFARSGAKQIAYHGSENVFLPYEENKRYKFVTDFATKVCSLTQKESGSYKQLSNIDLSPASSNGLKVLGFGDTSRCSYIGAERLKVNNNGQDHTFVPFKRNGQMELLDIVTGTLATRVGTFTELIE